MSLATLESETWSGIRAVDFFCTMGSLVITESSAGTEFTDETLGLVPT
jgi:hypothetical protein